MSDIFSTIMLIGAASTKYLVAVGAAFQFDYTFFESLLLLTFGGMFGVVVFSYAGDTLKLLWNKIRKQKNKQSQVKFTPRKRLIVKIRQRFGLAGIAFLTPFILTVPVGAMLANALYKNKAQVFTYMFFAFLFWSLLFCTLDHFVGLNVINLMH